MGVAIELPSQGFTSLDSQVAFDKGQPKDARTAFVKHLYHPFLEILLAGVPRDSAAEPRCLPYQLRQ